MINVTPEYLAEQGLSETFPERFWEKVFILPYDRGCWLWVATCPGGRYGGMAARYAGNYRTVMIRAHVASWILHYGPVPSSKCVCHKCDNPLCVRPDHLWLGTHQDNMTDMVAKGRSRSVHGETHKLSKLTDQQAEEIRASYSTVLKNGEVLAKRFGISRTQVHNIVKGYQRK